MRRRFFSILYRLTGHWMPDSYIYIPFFGRNIHISIGLYYRRFLASRAIKNCGKNVNFERHARFSRSLSIGDYSGIGKDTYVPSDVTIGKYCMLGPEIVFYTDNHNTDRTDIPMCQQGFKSPRPIVIEDDCWIGRRVIILPGVTIGRGSIVGAGAVVSKSIPPYSVAVGNPARVVKSRISTSALSTDSN